MPFGSGRYLSAYFCLPSSYASSKLLCSMGKGTSVQLPEVLSLHKGSRPLLSFSNGSHAAVLMLRISLPFSEMQDASDGWKSIPHTQPNDLPAFSRNQIAGAVRWPPWIVCFLRSFECLRLCGTCVATEMPFGVGDLREWPSSLFICHIYRAKGHPNLWPTLN